MLGRGSHPRQKSIFAAIFAGFKEEERGGKRGRMSNAQRTCHLNCGDNVFQVDGGSPPELSRGGDAGSSAGEEPV